jgi:uncharacterized protein YbjQ (UPF0145 family)
MKKIILLLIICSFFQFGCATWSTSSIDDTHANKSALKLPEKNAVDVFVTEKDITDRKYSILGDITATVNKTTVFHAEPTREMVNKKLQEKAAEMGADAVILVRYGTVGMTGFSWGSLEGKGRAIKIEK